jgi:chromosome segregation ATPase
MIRPILIFFVLAGIFLLGLWTQFLRTQVRQLENTVHTLQKSLAEQKSENQRLYDQYEKEKGILHSAAQIGSNTVSDLQMQLAQEKEKLQQARQALDALLRNLKSHTDSSTQGHIDDDNAQLTRLNQKLQELNSDGKSVADRSGAFRQQTMQGLLKQHQDNEEQLQQTRAAIQEIQGQIHALEQTRGDPQRKAKLQDLHAQLDSSKAQRAQMDQLKRDLNQQMGNTNTAIKQEVSNERAEIRADRGDLQNQIRQTQADLNHWQQLKKSQGQATQTDSAQVHQAQQAITSETQKVNDLQHMIETVNRSVPSTVH